MAIEETLEPIQPGIISSSELIDHLGKLIKLPDKITGLTIYADINDAPRITYECFPVKKEYKL